MPHRKPIEKSPHATILRRSPRFLLKEADIPKTPMPAPSRNQSPFLVSFPTLSSRRKGRPKKTPKHCAYEDSEGAIELNNGSKSVVKSKVVLRRSARLSIGFQGFSEKQKIDVRGRSKSKHDVSSGINLHEQFLGNFEKRVTRSCKAKLAVDSTVKLQKRLTIAERTRNGKSNRIKKCSSSIDSLDTVALSEQSASKKRGKSCPSMGNTNRNTVNNGDKAKVGVNLSKQFIGSSLDSSMVGETEKMGKHIDNGNKQVGVKRKRNQLEKGHGIAKGWTKEQDLALQRAYFSAKPTPHFWKKVARLVSGKSAQECFDRIHSDHMTPPPQPQPRSRTKKAISSLLSIPTTELTDSKIKKTYRKKKSHLVPKTMRELLQKQIQMDQNHGADLFSVLELSLDRSGQVFEESSILPTPKCNLEKSGFLKRCQDRSFSSSSSSRKKPLSRFSNGFHGGTLVSPPVLKQVKNKALHEKYIDQLHCREAKRKAAFTRAAKSRQDVEADGRVHKTDEIKAAKNALIFDAMEAINQFRHAEVNPEVDFSDDYDDDCNEDEGEDLP